MLAQIEMTKLNGIVFCETYRSRQNMIHTISASFVLYIYMRQEEEEEDQFHYTFGWIHHTTCHEQARAVTWTMGQISSLR